MESTNAQVQLKVFTYSSVKPHVPEALLAEMLTGREIVELDEKLYFHLKFQFRHVLFYNTPKRYALRVGPDNGQVAEFFAEQERYYLRPAACIDN